MPLYDYQCVAGHRAERLRSYVQRDADVTCPECQAPMERTISAPHIEPDGIYSHEENLGCPEAFERRHEAMKQRKRVIEAQMPANYEPRH